MNFCYPDLINFNVEPSAPPMENYFTTPSNAPSNAPSYKTTDVNIMKSYQPDYKQQEKTKVLSDGVNPLESYPFNADSKGVLTTVYLNLNNTNIRIRDNRVVSTVPILLKIENGVLYIWNAEHEEHLTLNSKGYSEVTGYKVNDFDGRKIKVNRRYKFLTWNIPNIKMNYVELKGDNNSVVFDDSVFEYDVDVYVLGKNRCSFEKTSFELLKVFTNYSNIEFNSSNTNSANLTVEGSGIIKGLTATGSLETKIVGDGTITCKKDDSTLTTETRYG